MTMNLKVLEERITAIAYCCLSLQCRARISRVCFALHFRDVDRRLGLSRRHGVSYFTVFLCGCGVDRHGALVLMFTAD